MSEQDERKQKVDRMQDPLIPVPIPPQPSFQEGVAELPHTFLWYTDTGGDGEPIVLLHPASGSGLVWDYQRPAFAAAGYRVITYSRRGFYKSAAVPAEDPGIASEDLHDLVAKLGIGRFHAVASAAGGSVAADYAVSHPDRLLSLVISSNSMGVSDGVIAEIAARIRPKEWHGLPRWFRELGPSYRAANHDGVTRWIDLEHRGSAPDGVRQQSANIVTMATLTTLNVPTLLLTGDADTSTPPALLRLVGKQLPNCQIVIAHESGHSLYWERPDIFNGAVLDFLAKHKA